MSQESLKVERLAGRYRYLEHARLLPLPSTDGITIVVELSHPEKAAVCLQLLLLHSGAPVHTIAVSMFADFPLEALSEQFTSEQPITFIPYENRGYQVNGALAQVETTFAVLLEDSIMVSSGWLSELIWPALEDTSVKVIAPLSSSERQFRTHEELTAYVNGKLEQRQGEWREVNILSGSCLVFAKELLSRVGGFDQRLRSRHLMIADWCLRARQVGARLAQSDAVYVHPVHSFQEGQCWMDEDTMATRTEGWKVYSSKWGLEDCEEDRSRGDEYLVPDNLSVYIPQLMIPIGHSPMTFPTVTAILYSEESIESHALKQHWKRIQEQQTYKGIRWIWVQNKLAETSHGCPSGANDVVITVHGDDAWLRALKNAALLHESEITMYLSATTKYETNYVEKVVEAMADGSVDLIVNIASHSGTRLPKVNEGEVLPLDRIAYRGGVVPGIISQEESTLQLLPELSLVIGYIEEGNYEISHP